MRKEDFFEVLGELDNDIVEGAKMTMKKNVNRKRWGAAAACIAAVAIVGIGVIYNGVTADPSDVGEPEISSSSVNEERTGGGKRVINFEGRVVKAEQDSVTLDNGKTVRITENTAVTAPDGSSAEVAVGDYIQGYAENAESSEIDAKYILITIL